VGGAGGKKREQKSRLEVRDDGRAKRISGRLLMRKKFPSSHLSAGGILIFFGEKAIGEFSAEKKRKVVVTIP